MRVCLLFVLEIPWPRCTFDKWVLSFQEGSPWPEPGMYLSLSPEQWVPISPIAAQLVEGWLAGSSLTEISGDL